MSFIKRITVVDVNKTGIAGVGAVAVATVYKEKRRKVSKGLRPFERMDRRFLKALAVFANDLRGRRERSSFKRKDGWLTDRQVNVIKAQRKASKVLRNG